MLAVKLHKKKKPWLGKGSFLIPISNWNAGKMQVRNWIATLNRSNKSNPNNTIRYVTLVNIPNEHPVFIGVDWTAKYNLFGKQAGNIIDAISFVPLCKIEDEIKKGLGLVDDDNKEFYYCQGYLYPEPPLGTPKSEFPELILGKALHSSYIKWIKDSQLLYKKKRKTSSPLY